jgi:hypothetical protein
LTVTGATAETFSRRTRVRIMYTNRRFYANFHASDVTPQWRHFLKMASKTVVQRALSHEQQWFHNWDFTSKGFMMITLI